MSNDNTTPDADDAFDWPGQDKRAEADVDRMAHTRPTSPATGAAAAAAARAAYQDATKDAPPADEAVAAEEQTAAGGPIVEEESGMDAAPEQGPEDASTPAPDTSVPDTPESLVNADAQLAAERLADYQRLNAEYVNYKRRVDRERAEDRQRATARVVESLVPVLDEIHFARQHGELAEGTPFAKIADKLTGILGQHGVEQFGEVGETFDPMVHEALMHTTSSDLPPGTTETTVVMVMQPGYRVGDRVIRAARVSVADPA